MADAFMAINAVFSPVESEVECAFPARLDWAVKSIEANW